MVNLNWQSGMTLESIEKEAILQALRFFRGNKTATALALGIAIRTLDNKLAQYETEKKAMEEVQDGQRRKRQEFQDRARGVSQSQQNEDEAARRVLIQSPFGPAKEHALPLPIGNKIQEVSSEQAPVRNTKKTGR